MKTDFGNFRSSVQNRDFSQAYKLLQEAPEELREEWLHYAQQHAFRGLHEAFTAGAGYFDRSFAHWEAGLESCLEEGNFPPEPVIRYDDPISLNPKPNSRFLRVWYHPDDLCEHFTRRPSPLKVQQVSMIKPTDIRG